MVTVVQTVAFMNKTRGKYTQADVDAMIETLSRHPHVGAPFSEAGNLFRHAWESVSSGGAEYDVVYVYHSSSQPLVVVNIFRRGEAALLGKTLACLAAEVSG